MTPFRMTRATLRGAAALAAVAATAPAALAATTLPADAATRHLARTGVQAVGAGAVAVTGTDCPDVPSPSFCIYSWASGTGRFTPTGFATEDGKLVVTGTFTGTTAAVHQTFAVAATAATVPVATVSVGRDAVVVTPATTAFGPYVEGGTPVTTTAVELPEQIYPAPGAVFATVNTITVRETRSAAARAARDWRRAGTDAAAQATVLDGLVSR